MALKKIVKMMEPYVNEHPLDFPNGIYSIEFSLDNESRQQRLTGDLAGIDLAGHRFPLSRYSPEQHKVGVNPIACRPLHSAGCLRWTDQVAWPCCR